MKRNAEGRPMTVTLKRRKGYLGIYPNGIGTWKFQPRFADLNAICEILEHLYLARKLSETESTNIQAMLGSPSVEWIKLGPGGVMQYKRVQGQ